MVGDAGRVLVVAPQPFYEDRGTPIAVRQVLEALVECGWGVDLLTYPMGRDPAIDGVRVFRCGKRLPIRSVRIGFSLRKVILDLALIPELRRRLDETTYVCVHAVEEAAFPAVWLARRRGLPVIYDMQSSLPEQLLETFAFRIPPLPRALRRLERWLLRSADYVVSSTGLAFRVGTLAPLTGHREWRFPVAAPRPTEEEVERLRTELNIPRGAPVLVYTGNLAPYQGIPLLLEAFPIVRRRHPNAVLVMVGIPLHERRRLRMGSVGRKSARWLSFLSGSREGAGPANLEGLRLVDRVPREALEPFYGLADILVSPRLSGSNLPLKVLDYLAAGRAIVATDIPAHRSVLNEERSLLVRPETEALGRGISRLLGDAESRQSLASAGHAYAEEHLGWPTFVEAIRQIYSEVAGGGAPADSAPAGSAADSPPGSEARDSVNPSVRFSAR